MSSTQTQNELWRQRHNAVVTTIEYRHARVVHGELGVVRRQVLLGRAVHVELIDCELGVAHAKVQLRHEVHARAAFD